MNASTIFTTVFPIVVAILTIYFNNVFSERAKKLDFFRNKKHEHIPYLYKEVNVILNQTRTLTSGKVHFNLPNPKTPFFQVAKYLADKGFEQDEIDWAEELWEKDYARLKSSLQISYKDILITDLLNRVQSLDEYFLSVELYLEDGISEILKQILNKSKEILFHEHLIHWLDEEDQNSKLYKSNKTDRDKKMESLPSLLSDFTLKCKVYLRKSKDLKLKRK
ncbi:hypothetical protein [Terribacillus sp. DMT04]|uniref:hypothetical protein n=1 Tax=Terribacillus sp. DMT04 TaxID=2850441 RepID=UPI001C2C398A|nr:hypothetical protein [Terribacillus sp. DMT04]QXE02783.1 hypothetical protein KS242_06280 [Terribacillus sp. DMT04]